MTTPRHACHQVSNTFYGDIAAFLLVLRATAFGSTCHQVFGCQFNFFDLEALNRMYDLADGQIAITHRRVQIIHGIEVKPFRHDFQVSRHQAEAFEVRFDQFFTLDQVLFMALTPEPLTHLCSRPCATDKPKARIEPVTAGFCILTG